MKRSPLRRTVALLAVLALACTRLQGEPSPEPSPPEPTPSPEPTTRAQEAPRPSVLADGLGFDGVFRSPVSLDTRDALPEAFRAELALAKQAGARYIRLHSATDAGFSQLALETLGDDLTRRDQTVQWTQEAGLEPIIMLGPWPGQRPGTFSSTYLPDESSYRAYVARVVERYDGDGVDDMPGLLRPVTVFEADNEPDLHYRRAVGYDAESSRRSKAKGKGKGRPGEGAGRQRMTKEDVRTQRGKKGKGKSKGQKARRSRRGSELPSMSAAGFQSPREYATLYRWTVEAAQSSSPDVVVLPAGLSGIKTPFGRQYWSAFLDEPGISELVPVTNIHVHLDAGSELMLMRAISGARASRSQAIWLTEVSAPDSLGARQHAAMVARVLFTAMANGVDVVLWHALRDPAAGAEAEHATGSLFSEEPKLAAHTYRAVAGLLAEIPHGGLSPHEAPSGSYAVRWTDTSGGVGYAAWATAPAGASLMLSAPEGATRAVVAGLVLADGVPFGVEAPVLEEREEAVEGGLVSVELTEEPVTIHFR